MGVICSKWLLDHDFISWFVKQILRAFFMQGNTM